MELINPSVELWEQKPGNTLEEVWKHVERCTRVCYQSERRNDNETSEDFCRRVLLRSSDKEANHAAMLEHGTIYLMYLTKWVGDDFTEKYVNNKYSRVVSVPLKENDPRLRSEDGWVRDIFCITTNLRVIYENNWWDDLKYQSHIYKHQLRFTFSMIANIGVSREANRHRVNSIAEESTRYCNYSKHGTKFVIPAWLNEVDKSYVDSHSYDAISTYCEDILANDDEQLKEQWTALDFYLFALTVCDFCYSNLIDEGWKPQQAREVLPLATKTQIVHTAYLDDWEHFIKLRSKGISGSPHPNMKLIADLIAKKLYGE